MASQAEQDLIDTVDELVDTLDPVIVAREAERFGITTDALMERVVTEMRARLS